MAIQTKDLAAIAAKWAQRAAAAGPDYTAGVKAPRKDWGQNTAAAADSWSQGVNDAVANGRFASGVQKAGTQKWQNGAVTKGSVRYPQGVQSATPQFQAGFGPYLQVIAGLTLAPRGPKGSPNNYTRSQQVGQALHQRKIGG